MQGVSIKNELMGREIDKSTLIGVLVGAAIAIVLAVVTMVKHFMGANYGLAFLAAIAGVFMLVYARDMWRAYNNIWTEYTIQVDDSVNFNQFMEKYEIVDKEDGGLYRVREK